jgi:lysophospholipid acyltransferase (LPLAT)-like uncharacterized protein
VSLGWKLAEWPVGITLWLAARGVAASARTTVVSQATGYEGPAVYVSWHQRLVYLCEHHGRAKRWLISSPAEYLRPVRRAGALLGLTHALGTSGEGGEQALAALEHAVRAGGSACFAVDGPAGPAHKAKPGAARLAMRCGVPLIPVSYRATPCLRFEKRWDELTFPLPFSQLEIRYGRPISPQGLDEPTLCRRIEEALLELDG